MLSARRLKPMNTLENDFESFEAYLDETLLECHVMPTLDEIDSLPEESLDSQLGIR
jgi:hypothetical protein